MGRSASQNSNAVQELYGGQSRLLSSILLPEIVKYEPCRHLCIPWRHNMKEDFISDKRRVSYLAATYNRIYRGQSVLIEGDFGAGKTRFLKLLRPIQLLYHYR